MKIFKSTFTNKLIYVFRINDKAHEGLLKIGEATINSEKKPEELIPNCNALNSAAKQRINQYTGTAGIAYDLLYTELAMHTVTEDGISKVKAFSDRDVHNVLERTGIKRHYFDTQHKANEWFKVDLETAKKAITAVKKGRSSLLSSEVSKGQDPIVFRPEQADAIKRTIKQFKSGNQMLWNAKMRFGKTLSALQVAKESQFKHILILTHRPVVSDSWYDDFNKIFYDTDYVFGSKTKGENINNLIDTDKKFVYFASMQDLRGSDVVGGKFDKNDEIFLTEWDFVVIDEAHEGTLTKLGQAVINTINELSNNPKILRLSGTPFNLLDKFKENEIFTWDYVMEQREKANWFKNRFGDNNPYAELPELQIFTYDLDKTFPGYLDIADNSFNFRKFFKTWTGDVKKDFKPLPSSAHVGDFINKTDVEKFLNLLCKDDEKTNYPFSKEEYRNYFRHTLWVLPGVKEAKALSALLKQHPVFGSGAFNIVNVAGDGDEEIDTSRALDAVKAAFGENPAETYSITLSCGRLTTGVTVPEWTAVFMLSGSFSTAASNYLQTIFRVQSPANIGGRIKERCCVFDFAPDRTLRMVAQAGRLSTKTGSVSNDRVIMGDLLNFCPVIAIDGSSMKPYDVDGLMRQLKRAYTDMVVRNGFDNKHIYNDNLLKLDEMELKNFEDLKKIVGVSKQTEKVSDIDLNNQGFNKEEYEELERIAKKPKKELTPEELALLEEKKKKKENAQKAMSILRGISIRIPLLIYGADVPVDKEITADNFVDLVDDSSWAEFMPNGVTKPLYKKFSKYYEQDIFVAAGKQIRNMALAADQLSPDERVKSIASMFAMFKNPDKETVLTPWRVVNMHMSDCLGGYCFYNEDFTDTIEEPRFVDRGKVTAETFANATAQILEINSKTGLYPLYVTYSIYRKRCDEIDHKKLTFEKQYELWQKTVAENVFVICKTRMARAITKRTLLGYRNGKINAHAFDDLIMQLKEKPEQFKEKVLRGSFWNKEVKNMKFDAIVGNPPYQLQGGSGGSNDAPIYQIFGTIAETLKPAYVSLIMPARWFAAGRENLLGDFRRQMINNKSLEKLVVYSNGADVFPNVEIKGGVCYYLLNKLYNGNCMYTYYEGNSIIQTLRDLSQFDIIIRDPRLAEIVAKIQALNTNKKWIDSIISNDTPFGIASNPKSSKKNPLQIFLHSSEEHNTKIFYIENLKRKIEYIDRKVITKNAQFVDYDKVLIPGAGGSGNDPFVLGRPTYAPKNSVCSQSFLFAAFDDKKQANNFLKFVNTKFFRILVSAIKISQSAPNRVYQFVPLQDFTENSDIDWSKSVAEIDQQLYKKYDLSDEEIAFIESKIKPME